MPIRRSSRSPAGKPATGPRTSTEGFATALPYADASFDRVLTSLVLHHLRTPQKQQALSEMRRVLTPGGDLHVADWVQPIGVYAQAASRVVQLVDGGATTHDNLHGRLPGMIAAAAFTDVNQTRTFQTIAGTLGLLRPRKAEVG